MNVKEINQWLEETRKIPYPSIPKLPKNSNYAKIVYDNYAGHMGELTAITQYIYEHILVTDQKELSKVLLQIAIEEMHHLDLLGQILTNLGEKPEYKSGKGCNYWDAKNVIYQTGCLKEMMNDNIEGENAAIRGYQQLIRITNNSSLRKLYQRILYDEMMHKKIFETIKNEC